ncbi:hypothetical protein IT881_08720 [Erythrobacter sp. A30-3]|nr:hypothetical protein IT881_08720 [Erythrobacter sp. A30-3]
MNYPVLELSRFDRIHRTNHIIDACKYPATDDTGLVHTMAHYMADCLFRLKTMGQEPRYWSFASFSAKRHDKSSIRLNSALVLEYRDSARASVLAELADIGLAHWIIDTESPTENRFAVIFPLANPILNENRSNRYTRLASVLLQQIGVAGAVDGCNANTFLIAPRPTALVQGFAGDILDPEPYIKDTAELLAQANSFIDRVKSEDNDDDGLFEWGGAA